MEETEMKIQIPGGGCDSCGMFKGESQEFLRMVLARCDGEWWCASCLARANDQLRDEATLLEGDIRELEEKLARVKE
jgi:hypothetical protein